ncbi:MAG: SHOCT domain-containing protein [Anaerolineaceae bacterium]
MMGNFGYGNMGWIGMILGSIISIALLIGLVLLIVWAVRQMSANPTRLGPQSSTGQSARDIAQARYAKGEISREEYQQILSDLGR